MLRLLAAVGLVLILTPRAAAPCCARTAGGAAWPETDILPSNGRITIYGTEVVTRIGEQHPVLVADDGEEVPLLVVETFLVRSSSSDELAEAVLEAAAALRPAMVYKFEQRVGSPGRILIAGNPRWRIGDRTDHSPPLWDAAPEVTNASSSTEFGYGASVKITVPVHDDGQVIYARLRLTLEDGESPNELEWMEPVREGTLTLETSLCHNFTRMLIGQRYTLRLSAVDAAGNESPAPGPPPRFRIPEAPPSNEALVTITLPLDVAPIIESKVTYPAIAKKAGVAGLVEASLRVAQDGAVAAVDITRSVPLLDPAVVEAVRAWRFRRSSRESVIPLAVQFSIRREEYHADWSP